jgi:hypothetical protein
VFNFLNTNKNLIINNTDINYENEVIELLPPLSYIKIDHKLKVLFISGNSFNVITTAFYTRNDELLMNFGKISDECKIYLKNILQPTIELMDKMKHIFNSVYNIELNCEYKIIHLRLGDRFIHNNDYDDTLYNI